MPRPLWQLLIDFDDPAKTRTFSCEECFTLLDYYAERLAAGPQPDSLPAWLQQRLVHCPSCQSQFADWVGKLERTEE